MSRSKRKTPILGMTASCSRPSIQKIFRSKENRAKRREVRIKLTTNDFDLMPHEKEYGNEWASPRDGKQYCGNDDPKWLRK